MAADGRPAPQRLHLHLTIQHITRRGRKQAGGGVPQAAHRDSDAPAVRAPGRCMTDCAAPPDRGTCSTRGFSKGDDTGGCRVGGGRGRNRTACIFEECVERGLETVIAEQRLPHHRGNLEACAHRRAGTAAHHIDAELQSAQALLVGLWKLAEKFLDQGQAARLKGRRIILGQSRPIVEIEGETEICRCLHFLYPGAFGNSRKECRAGEVGGGRAVEPGGWASRRGAGRTSTLLMELECRTGFWNAGRHVSNHLIAHNIFLA